MHYINKRYHFPLRDGMTMDGFYYAKSKPEKDKIVIICPGFSGAPFQYLYMALRDKLAEDNYDIYIPFIYSSEQKSGTMPRSMEEATTTRHIQDFDDAVDHFKKIYSQVYAFGHSLGGRVLLLSNNQNLTKQVLLDPSGSFEKEGVDERLFNIEKLIPNTNIKYLDRGDGMHTLVGDILHEITKEPFQTFITAAQNLTIPTLFAIAGAANIGKDYKPHINPVSKYVEIPEAMHMFLEVGTIEKLYKEIKDFIK